MGQRTYLPGPMGLARKPRTLEIRFFPDTANAPTYSAQDVKGVSSIARSAQGTFLITLQDTYKRLRSAHATVQHTTAVDLVAQIGDVANLATTNPVTVVVRLNAAATATDMAANANNSVMVTLNFDDADS
jgi:hypothetical protein